MSRAYERLGVFYLGREVDPGTGETSADPLLYDSRDLTTHGVIIGMTGSGKTGLGLDLLEEAAMDRIPVIAVDPKGDMGNLLLTFPELRPDDFHPWVNEDAARQQGVEPAALAAQQAELWRKGLAEWDQDGDRIRRLREHAEFAVYTPGSSAGVPVSVLRSFDAPPRELVEDGDGLRERVQSTVAGLLGLLGIDADPVRSRENILLSSILDDAWRKGRSLDLGGLIQAVQQPPFTRLGVMELESVFPSGDRFELAMEMNSLLASPSFQGWMAGEPLDIAAMLYTPEGRPKVSIFSIAHLGDAERMFFVTMLLSAMVGWMRSQPGTTSLRALLYMDEIFGFFPPVANPPSKEPMLTLLKQARAYGVGMVLATQNPVDLDYKGLGNTGTWFIGRLQTERDKARVLEALDGAMAGSTPIPRAELDRMLSGLGKRVFLMHNVHRGAPTLFTTRWAMSYLAGPLTLTQIRRLTEERMGAGARLAGGVATAGGAVGERTGGAPGAAGGVGAAGDTGAAGRGAGVPAARAGAGDGPGISGAPPVRETPEAARGGHAVRPVLPAEIQQFFVPPIALARGMTYRPAVLAVAEVRYSSAKHAIDETRPVQVLAMLEEGPIPFSLDCVESVELSPELLETEPVEGGSFATLPGEATQARSYDRWGKELVRWLQSAHPITLYESKAHRVFSTPGETERDFRMRLADLGHEARDAEADRLRRKYESRFRTAQERLRRAEQMVEKRSAQSKQAILSTGLSALGAVLGAAGAGRGRRATGGLLGAFLGGSASRATTAVRRAGRAAQSRQEVAHAEESVEAARAELGALEEEFQAELQKIEESADAEETLTEVVIRPPLNAISLRMNALVWLPCGEDANGAQVPVWR